MWAVLSAGGGVVRRVDPGFVRILVWVFGIGLLIFVVVCAAARAWG